MEISDALKRLHKFYREFKTWSESAETTSNRFTFENDSVNDSLFKPNRDPIPAMSIFKTVYVVGLIYPSSEPFAEHALRVEMHISSKYPQIPPAVFLLTKIRHPNIEKDGRICSADLDKNITWKCVSLAEVIRIVTKLMDEPEDGYAADAEMAFLYASNREDYNQTLTKMVVMNAVRLT